MEHPHRGPFKMPAWPVRHNGASPPVAPAPTLGQHNGDVLHDWLGMDAAQVAALRDEGAA
ncbi:MAG: CoA transferase, partial [SAR324 cluster bacterium]|nr:CoA transferase [SAR324 cluster bacterium]